MKIELSDLINEFRRVQMDLLEGVCGVGKCGSCGKGGTLGSSATPTYNTHHKLILTCVDDHCGKTNLLPSVGAAWVYEFEEPIEDLEEEEQVLVENICSVCDMEQALQRKIDKIAELEDGLASLVEKITPPLQDNIKTLRKSPQAQTRVGRSDRGNKENTPSSKKAAQMPSKSPLKGSQAAATDEQAPKFKNPFKAQPGKPKILLQLRHRSRSRDRDRLSTPDSTDTEEETRESRAQSKIARDGGGKKAEGQAEGPKKVAEDNDRGRRRVRSPSPDKAKLMDRSTSSTREARAAKKLRQEEEVTWMPTREEYEKLLKENEELKVGMQRLQLSINHLTSLLDDHKRREGMHTGGKETVEAENATAGGGKKDQRTTEKRLLEPESTGPKPCLEKTELTALEARKRREVENNSAAGGKNDGKRAKRNSKRVTAKEDATVTPPDERGRSAGDTMSYSQAAAKPIHDKALEEKQRKNRRERDKALLLFTAPETPKVAIPKEWRVMYIKWNLTTEMRKRTETKELHHLVIRMLEKVKVRKLIREVSFIGKSTIALYYITDFHERIKGAFTTAKVTMIERPSEGLPQDVGVRNAAVNRVAFLLRRHYYLTKLRALLLQQLDTEELRQEAITKSRVNHHD